MPSNQERSKLQKIYPEPQARYGMAARRPTVFRIPVIKLSFLLFFPVFFTIAIYSVQFYGVMGDWNKYAIGFIGIFCLVILSIIASVLMLLYAQSVVVRNCSRPWIIAMLYLFVVIPFGAVMLYHATDWFGWIMILHLILLEGAVLYALTFIVALVARQLTR